MNCATFSLRIIVACTPSLYSLGPSGTDACVAPSNWIVASAVSDTSEPMSKTMTVVRATSATVTATKRMTPITGETASVFLVLS